VTEHGKKQSLPQKGKLLKIVWLTHRHFVF
jgi:hypothetical protein